MTERSTGALARANTSARADARDVVRAWLLPFVLGAVGFALNALVKLPVQLPGHNALFWITALAFARLVSANPLGGMTAGAGAIAFALAVDPLEGAEVAVAGIALDLALALRRSPHVMWLPLAGIVANLAILGAKTAVGDAPHAVSSRGLDVALASYAAFGALGAAIAGLMASMRSPTRPTGTRPQR
ncbi:MAG TPA: hypothetical protein VI814_14090 [Candidatus Limnocylindria bacterium]